MKQLSKSRYAAFCQCSKNLWLNQTNRKKLQPVVKLRYCELDTRAMVKVWEKLKEKAGII